MNQRPIPLWVKIGSGILVAVLIVQAFRLPTKKEAFREAAKKLARKGY